MVRQAERSAATTDAILAAARKLFRVHGYDAVTIDDIAEEAGCKKGAVYHHFDSKQAIFERVLDDLQAALAAELMRPAKRTPGTLPARAMANSIQAYVSGANHPDMRQILLIDGPVVLGWKRWREIDDRHFAGMVRSGVSSLLGEAASEPTIEAATRLILGAVMEASIACSATPDPAKAAARYRQPLELMLSGFALQSAPRSD